MDGNLSPELATLAKIYCKVQMTRKARFTFYTDYEAAAEISVTRF